MNQVATNNFQRRVLKLVMSFDRIFLFRKLFVVLAMLLLITGLSYAQNSSHGLKSSRPDAPGKSLSAAKERIIVGETKQLGAGAVRSWVSLDGSGNPTA